MRKGISNFCNGDGSTSTLDQALPKSITNTTSPSPSYSIKTKDINSAEDSSHQPNVTLEQMILQLELEEEIARKAKQLHNIDHGHHRYNNYNGDTTRSRGTYVQGRMSCVNNSDILRSARNALNQYPRFSLDGKDAMYRSSFRNNNYLDYVLAASDPRRKSVCCDHKVQLRERIRRTGNSYDKLGGEGVVWCNPGVVAKLMGLDAIPVPIIHMRRSHNNANDKEKSINPLGKRQNLMRKSSAPRRMMELEARRVTRTNGDHQVGMPKRYSFGGGTSSSSTGRSRPIAWSSSEATVMKTILDEAEPAADDRGGWPARRFRF